MRKKQQTTEHEDSPDHIILHHTCSTSASREKLNSPKCWVEPFGSFFWGYLFSVICTFLYYAYSIILNDRRCGIYLFFSAALFTVLTARC